MTSFFCLSKQGKGGHEEEEETNPAQDKDVSKETASGERMETASAAPSLALLRRSMLSSVARGPTR